MLICIPLQYACFSCRKCFKRPQFYGACHRFMTSEQLAGQQREAARYRLRPYKCPDCGGPVHYMGKDFKTPKRTDIKAWRQAQQFILSGNVFYRGSQN